MKITFHGAARQVTGSKHLLELKSGKKILLDCGMFQGNPKAADALNRNFGFIPAEIDFLILSHAHIDHCGLIPKLVAEGFRGKIFCTPATFDLTKILLLDSAHIQESDIKYQNKKNKAQNLPPLQALYSIQDAENCFTHFELVNYHDKKRITDEVEFFYTDAGHILGSAAVHVNVTEDGKQTCITFSGDVGRYNDDLLYSPEEFRQADYILLESTYGNSLHDPTELTSKKLLDTIINTCLKKKGKLIIPSFSVGRTQEIVYTLNQLDIDNVLPQIDFFVDSPLSVEATQVMKDHMDYLNPKFQEYRKKDPAPFDFKRLHYITEVEDSKALNDRKEPCVIISASGMADAGRVKHHIKNNISDQRNTILIVGYCEPNSLGGKLVRGVKDVTIFGEPFKVQAEVKNIHSLSAHGDYNDLFHFIASQDKTKIKQLFLVHGEYETQQAFEGRLKAEGYTNIQIPDMHQTVELT